MLGMGYVMWILFMKVLYILEIMIFYDLIKLIDVSFGFFFFFDFVCFYGCKNIKYLFIFLSLFILIN